MMKTQGSYKLKSFDLSGLKGISDQTIEMHFKLYEGYVKAANELTEKISELLEKGKVDHENVPAYSELKRRLGYEYNGMVLHEYYFGNLEKNGGGDPPAASLFYQKAKDCFGSFEVWKEDFISVGKMRGVGWAVCYEDPGSGSLSNHWITSHEVGHIAGYRPLLVMDMWEHAFLLDYKPSEKEKYIEAFFANVGWQCVENTCSGKQQEGKTHTTLRETWPQYGGKSELQTNNKENGQ
ncbi:MAG: superoxide dismutase [Nitrospiria bacterium]